MSSSELLPPPLLSRRTQDAACERPALWGCLGLCQIYPPHSAGAISYYPQPQLLPVL